MKCATTVSTRYPKANKATIDVYFNESSRRKKDNGIITSLRTVSHEYQKSYMKAVIQNCRSKRKGIDFADGKILPTTWGIKSPMMIRYETATPSDGVSHDMAEQQGCLSGGRYRNTLLRWHCQRQWLLRDRFSLPRRKTMNGRVRCGGRSGRGSRGRFRRCSLRR
jgi:hypothetical protein